MLTSLLRFQQTLKEICCKQGFTISKIQSPMGTLKKGLMSPKPNQIFRRFKQVYRDNLVRFQQVVKEIVCRQGLTTNTCTFKRCW